MKPNRLLRVTFRHECFPQTSSKLVIHGAELAVLDQQREKTRALKHAMMQALLTGRTRLI